MLGQRYSQADVDEFKSGQSFTGEISHLNIWNITLGSNVISSMSRGCDLIGGNWFDWSAILNGEVAGSVTMEKPALCMLPGQIEHFVDVSHYFKRFCYSGKLMFKDVAVRHDGAFNIYVTCTKTN